MNEDEEKEVNPIRSKIIAILIALGAFLVVIFFTQTVWNEILVKHSTGLTAISYLEALVFYMGLRLVLFMNPFATAPVSAQQERQQSAQEGD